MKTCFNNTEMTIVLTTLATVIATVAAKVTETVAGNSVEIPHRRRNSTEGQTSRIEKLEKYIEKSANYFVGFGGSSNCNNPMGKVEEPINPYPNCNRDTNGFFEAFSKFEKGCLIDPRRMTPKPWDGNCELRSVLQNSTSVSSSINRVCNIPGLLEHILKIAVEKEFMEVQARFFHYKNLRKVHQTLAHVLSNQSLNFHIDVACTQEQHCARNGISMYKRWQNRGFI